jgi:hypothetical protein
MLKDNGIAILARGFSDLVKLLIGFGDGDNIFS